MTWTELPSSAARMAAACRDFSTRAPQVTMVSSSPADRDPTPPERNLKLPGREGITGVGLAQQVLVLEEHHRVLGLQRRPQQPDRVRGPGRHHDGETGNVGEDRLPGLGVPDGPAGHVAADRHPQHHRAGERAVGTPPDGGRLALDLVHGRPDVVEELHLGHGPQPPEPLPDGPPDDVGLGQRRVVAAGQTEAALEAEGGAEHAALALHVGQHGLAGVGDVLAEHPDAFVLLHLFVEGAPDGLTEGDDLAAGRRRRTRPRDRRYGRATTWSRTRGRIGPGGGQGPAGRRQHGLAGLLLDAGHLVGGQHPALEEDLLHEDQRIVGGLVGQLVRRAVLALGVLRRMRVGAGHGGVDERRAHAGPDFGHDVGRPGPHLEVIAPVQPVNMEAPEAADQLGDRRRRLIGGWDRNGEAVVGDHEQAPGDGGCTRC